MKDHLENESNIELKPKKLDRIVLDSESVEVIKNIMSQVESQLGGLIQVSPKLIGNFILKKRSVFLTTQELEDLRAENHDIIKALKMAMVEAVKAKQNGSEVDLNELLKNIQTPGVNSNLTPKKTRGRKKKLNAVATTTTENKSDPNNHNQSSSSKNQDNKLQNPVTIIENFKTQNLVTFS